MVALTAIVLIGNETALAPVMMVTDAGTVMSALLDVTFTTSPADPAATGTRTIPSEFFPPTTEVGSSVKLEMEERTVKEANLDMPPSVAVRVTTTLDETGVVGNGNETAVVPFSMVTCAGTVATDELEAIATTSPKDPAGSGA